MRPDSDGRDGIRTRSLAWRVVFAAVWFIAIYLIVAIVIGGIVGGLASGQAENADLAFATGRAASEEFFERYVLVVVLCVLGVVVALARYEILPGTNKWRDPDVSIRRRWFNAPAWLRYSLILPAAFLASGAWGFACSILGAPNIVTSLGVIVIAPTIVMGLARDST